MLVRMFLAIAFVAGLVSSCSRNHPFETKDLNYYIDKIEVGTNTITIVGWAFVKNAGSEGAKTCVVLVSGNRKTFYPVETVERPDVSQAFAPLNCDQSGFRIVLDRSQIGEGAYRLGLSINNATGHHFQYTPDYFSIYNDQYYPFAVSDAEYLRVPYVQMNNLRLAIDRIDYRYKDLFILIKGWAFLTDSIPDTDEVYIALFSQNGVVLFTTIEERRVDVTRAFGSIYNRNLDASGFAAIIPAASFEKGIYELGVYIKGSLSEGFLKTGWKITNS